MIELSCFHPLSLKNPCARAKSTLARPHHTSEETLKNHEAVHAHPLVSVATVLRATVTEPLLLSVATVLRATVLRVRRICVH